MRFWNDWADEHWDMVALATRLSRPAPAPNAVVVEDGRGPLDPARL